MCYADDGVAVGELKVSVDPVQAVSFAATGDDK